VLNLVGAPTDLAALVDDPHPLAVLAPDLPDPAAIVPLNRETAAADRKKAPAPPGTDEPESAPPAPPAPPARQPARPSAIRNLRGCLRLIMVPAALLLALALAMFGALFYLR
jgi:hypothetical protein